MSTTHDSELAASIEAIGQRALEASRATALLSTEAKNRALLRIADAVEEGTSAILEANAMDLEAGTKNGLSGALLDRLRLDPERIAKMSAGVRAVAELPDPVGEEIERLVPDSGIDIRKIRVPIGVIAIIYESRPNVTIDCAVLSLKSGNACVLRGGKEAFHSNRALAAILEGALRETGLPDAAIQLIPTTDRAALNTLLRLDQYIHCIIPRGGEGLIRFVAEHSRIPVIKHYDGICNLYVHRDSQAAMATDILLNAKVQRPGVCNAVENLLVDRALLDGWWPEAAAALIAAGVTIRADADAAKALRMRNLAVEDATEEDYKTEYLDKILAVRTVEGLDEAVAFINRYGSGHSDAIVTADAATAEHFLNAVDSATVYWNASTRFTDGFEFGFGAEIGISTDRLHARGPMGLRELCTYKFKIYGHGEVR